MAKRDYYTVLGRHPRRVRRGHQEGLSQARDEAPPGPQSGDKGAEDKFKEAKEAYEVLSDARKRAAYDQFGHAGVDPSAGFGAAGARGAEGFGGFADAFGDIFGEIFGQQRGGARGNGVYRGADLRYNLELSLEDAAHGTDVKIRIPTMEECETCHGNGAKPGHAAARPARRATAAARCAYRRASSRSSRRARNAAAPARSFPSRARPAAARAAIKKHKTLSVKIPAGVDQDDRIRLTGEGEAGVNGGPPGDLYVVVT